jgi:hypothetical protein
LLDLLGGTTVRLPAQRLRALVEEADPDVLIVDVEGRGGATLQGFQPPPRLRHASAACFAAMVSASMAYDPDGSSRTKAAFSRT